MLSKLKHRWNVKTNFQLVVILFVFSVSGSLTLFFKTYIFGWIDYNPLWPLYLKITIYVLTVVPVYQLTLMTVGTLLGQFDFFWRFEKKAMRRFGIKIDKP